MSRNLLPKFILVVALVAGAVWTLFPPSKRLKPGIDLAGGTSLIYAIDTTGLDATEEKDLSQKMITTLRRRIDPTNIQNLVWRPQGNTRFEIQMPLASPKTQEKRQEYETALNTLLERNVSPAIILRNLQLPAEERDSAFKEIAQDDPNRVKILADLAAVYDERTEMHEKRGANQTKLSDLEEKISQAGLDLARIKANRSDWARLSAEELATTLKDFLGDEESLALLTDYVTTYADLADVLNRLTAESGVNDRYDAAKRELDQLNLTMDQINYALELPEDSARRSEAIEKLKTEFTDRVEEIDQVVTAYAGYRPYRGRLDDPRDLQRMLKGAGILEFRILPTAGQSEPSAAEIERYKEALTEKGPKYASDSRYVWCEIENPDEPLAPRAITAPFGDKVYVLASNRQDEAMLHTTGGKDWKLENSKPTTDRMGRRAIGFLLDVRGGNFFYRITGKNPGRLLCILLDDIAISAPKIEEDTPIGRNVVITGSFTETEVSDMVNKLNAGSLPARLIEQPISEKTIGPSIGADNRDQGIRAGFIGLIVVMGVMLVYYVLAGAIADVALLMNILFVLAIMAGLRATFTLPGIAGIILTIGMSVDANVLIFERIREEQRKGSGLAIAIRNGYQRAFRAIFDANLTTFITAAILYYVASEEIKGFAIVLMLGIASSMFTALFVTRLVFDVLVAKRLMKDHLFMLRLIHEPNVNWMGLRKVFLGISAVLIVSGLAVFFTRDSAKNNKYDIEFTGGTSVQINLKESTSFSRQDVQDKIQEMGRQLGYPALEAANVYSVGKSGRQYEITTTATNKVKGDFSFSSSDPNAEDTAEGVTDAIEKTLAEMRRELTDLQVTRTGDRAFTVTTSRVNPVLLESVLQTAFPQAEASPPEIDEVVNDAIRKAFEGELEVQENLQPTFAATEKITQEMVDQYPEIVDYMGGLWIDCRIVRPASLDDIRSRIGDLLFKPDTQQLVQYSYELFGPDLKQTDPNQPLQSFIYVSAPPEVGLRELGEDEWNRFVENETTRVRAATTMETSLPRVTQIDPSVGSQQKTRAMIAIVLSLSAIVGYIWLRFGDLRYGLAAIAALVHDVSITLGAVTACTYIAGTVLGVALLVGDFKIDLAMIAAFLTLIGYSLNDTIVVFDRIRENRHKARLNPQTITSSINQTISRTIMTSVTTFVVVLVMYIFGGQGLRGFTFAIGFGVIIGTYSSIAIAAPLLLLGSAGGQDKAAGVKAAKSRPKAAVR